MEDTERLLRALHNLIESEERRIAQWEKERKEEKKKELERAERRKQLYNYFYKRPSPYHFYVPKGSSLLDKDKDS